MEVNWNEFNVEDNFVDTIESEMGLAPQTVRKYKEAWRKIFANPSISKDVKEKLLGKSVKSLLLLAPAAGEDVPIDWDVVVSSTNDEEIREEVRRVNGEKTSSGSSILISLARDGTLNAQKGKGGTKKP
jgi:hypothetical protein